MRSAAKQSVERQVKISDRLYRKIYIELAQSYFETRTCKYCGKPTLKQYICVHCRKDDD